MDKEEKYKLRELMRKSEERKYVEDAYSVKGMEDSTDDDFMTAAEQGFMNGYVS